MYKLGHTVPIIGGLRYHDDEYCIHSPFRTSHSLRRSGTVGDVQDLCSSVYIEYRECAELDRLSIPLRPNILSFLCHKISIQNVRQEISGSISAYFAGVVFSPCGSKRRLQLLQYTTRTGGGQGNIRIFPLILVQQTGPNELS
jgi:hypothetical protein